VGAMSEQEPTCIFCNVPTSREQVDGPLVGEWGGTTIQKRHWASVCRNPECHSYGEDVATK